VRHAGHRFHVQTEDSGRDRPHIITHLFTAGTILATKKQSYAHLLDDPDWEPRVRQLMKDQHKAMFVELRDGTHDGIASRILGKAIGGKVGDSAGDSGTPPAGTADAPGEGTPGGDASVRVIRPAEMSSPGAAVPAASAVPLGHSVFETPDTGGSFGESLVSDKSLDEVILAYLQDDLDE